jgi:hypothetical protein
MDELGRHILHRQNPPETLQELRDALVDEWNNIPQAFIQRLIGLCVGDALLQKGRTIG